MSERDPAEARREASDLRAAITAAERDARGVVTWVDELRVAFEESKRGHDPDAIPAPGLERPIDALETLFAEWEYSEADLLVGLLTLRGARTYDDVVDTLRAIYDEYDREWFVFVVGLLEHSFDDPDDEAIQRRLPDVRRAFDAANDDAFFEAVDGLQTALPETPLDSTVFENVLDERPPHDLPRPPPFDVLDRERRTERIETLREAVVERDDGTFEEVAGLFSEVGRAIESLATVRWHSLDRTNRVISDAYPEDHDMILDLLDGDQPVLLLPVRLETRFEPPTDGGNCVLRVRIYPDELHADTHEPEPTLEEIDDGIRFWKLVYAAAADRAEEFRTRLDEEGLQEVIDAQSLPADAAVRHTAIKDRAWTQLVEQYDRERASWIMAALAPTEGDVFIEGPPTATGVERPDFEGIAADAAVRPDSWTRPPRARLLPDRWVALATHDGTVTTATSGPVRESLLLGPDPGISLREIRSDEGDETDPLDDLDWLTDFQTALEAGMALEIDLPWTGREIEGRQVDQLVVLGVKAGMDDKESSFRLRDLLAAHHYTDGLEFLSPGTPTNNTSDASAGMSPTDGIANGPSRQTEGPDLGSGGGTDGDVLARAMGISPAQLGPGTDGTHVFANVSGAEARSDEEAGAMNAVLWASTLGYYVPHVLGPEHWREAPASRRELLRWLEAYRRHFVEFVRAAGPLPTLRVGDQPYGVLPTTAPERWKPVDRYRHGKIEGSREEHSPGRPRRFDLPDVETDLRERLGQLRPFWHAALDAVPTVGESTDPVEDLIGLLGMGPTGRGYFLREILGSEPLTDLGTEEFAGGIEPELDQWRSALGSLYAELDESAPTPRLARLLTVDDPASLAPLVGPDPRTFIDDLLEARIDDLRQSPPVLDDGEGTDDGTPLERLIAWIHRYWLGEYGDSYGLFELLVYNAYLQELVAARFRLAVLYEDPRTDVWTLLPEPEAHEGERTIWDAFDDPVPSALTALPDIESEDTYGDVLVKGPHRDLDAPLKTFRENLRRLRDRDSETLERLLAGTLGLVSHRLDTWVTSLATERLAGIRTLRYQREESLRELTNTPAGPISGRETLDRLGAAPRSGLFETLRRKGDGIHIGAYGWVERLRPRGDDEAISRGYVHAPSLSQATTAAVLRSAYDAHSNDALSEALAVNLSADRVRLAREIIESVREGQPLGACLGYRFERGLRENQSGDTHLGAYLFVFRELAPLVAGKFERDHGEDPDPDETAQIAARNVVDGVTLVRLAREDRIPWGTESGPRERDGLPPRDSAEGRAIDSELTRLAESVDAVRDVLLTESVHQLVSGNPARASASLDALSRGEAPAALEVTETPRTGTGVTHRLVVLLGESSTPVDWPSGPRHVRAAAEPAVNAWAGQLIGSPTRIYCLATYAVEGTETEAGEYETDTVPVSLSALDLAPLDVISLVSDDTVQHSELEQRVEYAVRRDPPDDMASDGPVELSFAPLAEWDPETLPTDVDVASAFGFGEFLEHARAIAELIGSSRPVDTRDLVLPEDAPDDTASVDIGDLVGRADAAVTGLAELAADLRPLVAVHETSETDGTTVPNSLDRLETLSDRMTTFGDAHSSADLRGLATELSDIDTEAVATEFENLEEGVIESGAVTVDLDEGGPVELAPRQKQRVIGTAATHAGEEIAVRIRSTARARPRFLLDTSVIVDSDGSFEATFDMSGTNDGAEFEVTVRTSSGDSHRIPGHVKGDLPRREIDPIDTPILERLVSLVEVLQTIAETAGESPSDGAQDLISVFDALTVVRPRPTYPEGASQFSFLQEARTVLPVDESGYWDDEAAVNAVDTLLALDSVRLPAFDSDVDTDRTWTALISVAELRDNEDGDGQSVIEAFLGSDQRDPLEMQDALDMLDPLVESNTRTRLETLLAGFSDGCNRLARALDAAQNEPVYSFRVAVVRALREELFRASYFGLSGSVPQSAVGYSSDAERTLAQQATSVFTEVTSRLAAVGEPERRPVPTGESATLDDVTTQVERLETVFGASISVLPRFRPPNTAELDRTFDESHSTLLQGDDPTQVETWFHRVSRLRDRTDRLGMVLTYADLLTGYPGDEPRFHVGQLPFRVGDTWVSLPDAWEDNDDRRRGGRVSIVAHLADTVDFEAGVTGFLVDEWTETIPSREETTGVTFHFDAPGARAPQSLLLAVPPTGDGWTLETLAEIVDESIELSKLRTVDLETLRSVGADSDDEALQALGLLLPAICVPRNSRVGPERPDTVSVDLAGLISTEEAGLVPEKSPYWLEDQP